MIFVSLFIDIKGDFCPVIKFVEFGFFMDLKKYVVIELLFNYL